MNFIEALTAINAGDTVSRRTWGGKAKVYLVKNKLNNINHIEVRNVTNCIMYAASSADLLAMDWEIMDRKMPLEHRQLNTEKIQL